MTHSQAIETLEKAKVRLSAEWPKTYLYEELEDAIQYFKQFADVSVEVLKEYDHALYLLGQIHALSKFPKGE